MLDERTAIISGKGSSFDDLASVTHKVFMQAAITGQQRGFQYFQILDDKHGYRPTYVQNAATSSTTGTVTKTGRHSTSYNETTTSTPASVTRLDKPMKETVVRFYKTGEVTPGQPGIWSVQSILSANGS
ncbi:hypothetical protein [Acetobacter orleanensis]|uniref:Uncharacterized protein n=1 Tax=Acetobacter orleanensis TaxID=104099 RepID=A0A4Y3TKJ3_9PROT|nr:hypothetical protein [Acetobacter orleanensis]KXV65223.1 hypothetical protein AD949_04995 [Acetobacter orleanensis]PCD79629.1 hypothetical protein CO710_05310 [Acetobacter orleanensis]GAN68728.1 hypothetical protein Abol_021_083 [Acetobacter orleanensis JCM 7639]GBR24522.1 hypothetical protein AA0473_0654 [Acetobacter orleanensis NRIC 0473]GEB82298.1 hypothetical protein AOR01nite_07750 [Acetobacter orleanensis]